MFLKAGVSPPPAINNNNRRYKGLLEKEDEVLKRYLSKDERYADLSNSPGISKSVGGCL